MLRLGWVLMLVYRTVGASEESALGNKRKRDSIQRVRRAEKGAE